MCIYNSVCFFFYGRIIIVLHITIIGGKSLGIDYDYKYGILSFIGIICVVMGHLGCDILSFNGWLPYASFHMELFFFISGCFYKTEREKHIIISILYYVKSLLLPFYINYIVYWFINYVFNSLCDVTIGINISFIDYIKAPFTNVQPIGFCAPAWFVISLFGIKVFHLLVQKILGFYYKTEKIKLLITMILYVFVGTICFKISAGGGILTGWKINILKIMFGLSFYLTGYIFHQYLECEIKKVNIFIFLSYLIIFRELLWIRTGDSSIAYYSFSGTEEGYFVIVFSAIIGIMFWYVISCWLSNIINKNGIIIYVGKHTFSVMIHHLFIVFIIQGIVMYINKYIGIIKFDEVTFKSKIYFVFSDNPIVPMLLSVLSIVLIAAIQRGYETLNRKVKDIWTKQK